MKIMTKNLKIFCVCEYQFHQNWSRNDLCIIFEEKNVVYMKYLGKKSEVTNNFNVHLLYIILSEHCHDISDQYSVHFNFLLSFIFTF
jgi:hypothetical protein